MFVRISKPTCTSFKASKLGLTVLSWLGSTVITICSLSLKDTMSSKAGIFPAVTRTRTKLQSKLYYCALRTCFNTYKWPQTSSHGVSSSCWLYGGSLFMMKSLFMWAERTSCIPVSILSARDLRLAASCLLVSRPSLLPYTHTQKHSRQIITCCLIWTFLTKQDVHVVVVPQ